MIVRLESGNFEVSEKEKGLSEIPSSIEKKALLVYAGKFNSLDGEVDITDEVMQKLMSNHNGRLKKLGESIGMKRYPPIQLDHSTSATHTVGRLTGDIEMGEHQTEDGQKVKALFGTVKILGKENVEKVLDGRWTNLSIGADLESGKFSELTITPFPAADEASLLSSEPQWKRGPYGYEFKKNHAGAVIRGSIVHNGVEWEWEVSSPFEKIRGSGRASNPEEAIRSANALLKIKLSYMGYKGNSVKDWDKLSRFGKRLDYDGSYDGVRFEVHTDFESEDLKSDIWLYLKQGKTLVVKDYVPSGGMTLKNKVFDLIDAVPKNKRLAEGEEPMPSIKEMKEAVEMYEKCKKHLTEEKKMSEEEAEKHLEKASDEDKKKLAEEHDAKRAKMAEEEEAEKKKLAEEEEEKKKLAEKDEEEKKAEMSRLSKEFSEGQKKVARLMRKNTVHQRLSNLKAKGKLTPAEFKRLKLDEMVDLDDKSLDAVIKAFEVRDPQILAGVYGSAQGMNVQKVMSDIRMKSLEEETLANMSFTGGAKKRMSEQTQGVDGVKKETMSDVNVHVDPTPHTHVDLSEFGSYDDLAKMIDEDKKDEVKDVLRRLFEKMAKPEGGEPASPVDSLSDNEHKELMSTLASEITKLQNSQEKLVKLAGIKSN